MNKPLECIQIGVGGQGRHWCEAVVPRLMDLGLAVPIAAVDINPDILPNAKTYLGLSDDQLYTSAEQALAEHKPDFINIVVPPAHHEEMANLAVEHGCHILSEKPIADTMAACCRIYHKVKKAGLKMAVTMTHRIAQNVIRMHVRVLEHIRLELAIRGGEIGQSQCDSYARSRT